MGRFLGITVKRLTPCRCLGGYVKEPCVHTIVSTKCFLTCLFYIVQCTYFTVNVYGTQPEAKAKWFWKAMRRLKLLYSLYTVEKWVQVTMRKSQLAHQYSLYSVFVGHLHQEVTKVNTDSACLQLHVHVCSDQEGNIRARNSCLQSCKMWVEIQFYELQIWVLEKSCEFNNLPVANTKSYLGLKVSRTQQFASSN